MIWGRLDWALAGDGGCWRGWMDGWVDGWQHGGLLVGLLVGFGLTSIPLSWFREKRGIELF